MFITAACVSRSAQIRCRVSTSSQMPSHVPHSKRCVVPTLTFFKAALHRGQSRVSEAAASLRSPLAPQCEQNFAPANIIPKQNGQATVARPAPQKLQRVESDETAAPHEGQRSVSTGMVVLFLRALCLYSFYSARHGKPPGRMGD